VSWQNKNEVYSFGLKEYKKKIAFLAPLNKKCSFDNFPVGFKSLVHVEGLYSLAQYLKDNLDKQHNLIGNPSDRYTILSWDCKYMWYIILS
jgi:hypothetical protein